MSNAFQSVWSKRWREKTTPATNEKENGRKQERYLSCINTCKTSGNCHESEVYNFVYRADFRFHYSFHIFVLLSFTRALPPNCLLPSLFVRLYNSLNDLFLYLPVFVIFCLVQFRLVINCVGFFGCWFKLISRLWWFSRNTHIHWHTSHHMGFRIATDLNMHVSINTYAQAYKYPVQSAGLLSF